MEKYLVAEKKSFSCSLFVWFACHPWLLHNLINAYACVLISGRTSEGRLVTYACKSLNSHTCVAPVPLASSHATPAVPALILHERSRDDWCWGSQMLMWQLLALCSMPVSTCRSTSSFLLQALFLRSQRLRHVDSQTWAVCEEGARRSSDPTSMTSGSCSLRESTFSSSPLLDVLLVL